MFQTACVTRIIVIHLLASDGRSEAVDAFF